MCCKLLGLIYSLVVLRRLIYLREMHMSVLDNVILLLTIILVYDVINV